MESGIINKTGKSFPKNFKSLGNNILNLVSDPVKTMKNISLLTPISILFKTSVNTLKIAWNGIVIVGEPVYRLGSGTIILAGAPFFKPACYTGTAGIFAVTSVYGYGSSATGGTVMLGATGTVFALDVATSPFVFLYNLTDKNQNVEYINIDSDIKINK